MKGLKRFKALAALLALVLVLAACSNSGKTSTAPADNSEGSQAASKADDSKAGGQTEGKVIEVVAKGFQHQFWKAVYSGAQKA
ncbi:MAG: LacI family transcriptional regulator, partial [Peptoniphilaceae bacterium]|nr:LacI family transcriptional regulator [Peptoniphilaceae bacterium]